MIHAEFRYLTAAAVFNEHERSHNHKLLGGLRWDSVVYIK